MGFTDKFKAQHDDILQVAGDITAQLKAKGDPAALRKMLSNLAGKVNFHLAMEDKALYPRLMKQTDANAPIMAAKFLKEMGGLAKVTVGVMIPPTAQDVGGNIDPRCEKSLRNVR